MNRVRQIRIHIDSMFGTKMFQAYLLLTVMNKDAESISDYQLHGVRFTDAAKLQEVMDTLADRGWEQQPMHFRGIAPTLEIEIVFERKEYFPITSVCRDDFWAIGYDADKLTDDQMREVATSLGENFTSGGDYWLVLEDLADSLNLPTIEKEIEA